MQKKRREEMGVRKFYSNSTMHKVCVGRKEGVTIETKRGIKEIKKSGESSV